MAHAVTTKDLDALDCRIIDQLQDDGPRSNVAIARALGVTEATIRNRIDRLVVNGFIRIAAVIDPRKTPYLTDAMIWIRLERGLAREAGEHLASLPNVVSVAYTAGRYDMLIEALFESDDQLFEFLHGTLSKVRGCSRVRPITSCTRSRSTTTGGCPSIPTRSWAWPTAAGRRGRPAPPPTAHARRPDLDVPAGGESPMTVPRDRFAVENFAVIRRPSRRKVPADVGQLGSWA